MTGDWKTSRADERVMSRRKAGARRSRLEGGAGTWRYKRRRVWRTRGIIHGERQAPQVRDGHQGRGLGRREGLGRIGRTQTDL